MAFNDVPLGDAGRNYYQQQFGSRVQNIRKVGAAPATRNSGCGMVGGGAVALLVLIRIIIAVAVGMGGSSYNSGSNYSAPSVNYDPPQQIDWNNDLKVDPPVRDERPWANPDWQNPPVFPPVDPNPPIVLPDDPPRFPDLPIFVPDDGPKEDK